MYKCYVKGEGRFCNLITAMENHIPHAPHAHTCMPARCVHVKADITHAALLTTRVFPTTLYI